MKLILFLTAALPLLCSLSGFGATTPASTPELYCFEVPLSPPIYFGVQSRSCDNGGKNQTVTLCAEASKCGYVTDSIKEGAVDSNGQSKAWDKLTDAERTWNLKQNPDFQQELNVTLLTCPSNPGSTTCPTPNHCVGDKLLQGHQSDFQAAEAVRLQNDANYGTGHFLPLMAPAQSKGVQ